ncbi:NAD-dependent epimerase/dehydratase family protein [Devosia sp.]|uniref:UDP-2-acetamido-2,6-beta-L-arabino-hexul-4-ose reductase n=1 Tax=Devosia sp. TaxID=1871048 RepID=UPI00273458E9|nr:NAD-dependent epimerase/dehydratase family protein [Devosia sp.]MDP2782157.1 NAD-dependent epimerase/dehydratase family protein [Devosia sp.]
MNVLITGAQGFVGRNLSVALGERSGWNVLAIGRGDSPEALVEACEHADAIIHLAGANRPVDPAEFLTNNRDATQRLCDVLTDLAARTGRRPSVLYASSTQATQDNPYGASKRAAEEALHALSSQHGHQVHIFRLPNVFGKWCRPHYNSAVATFCHQVARDLPIEIRDPAAPLNLVHVDDVIDRFLALLDGASPQLDAQGFEVVGPVYSTTVGDVATTIRAFRESRETGVIGAVGHGLGRALYATYVSNLPVEAFDYPLVRHEDHRGVFVEMLKTRESGQFSFFTAHPGVTRGGHYHRAKTEKFLVIQGEARFRFRHILTAETHEIRTNAQSPRIVETIPGWAHDITNTGDQTMIVMLWANEIFDQQSPDTIAAPL